MKRIAASKVHVANDKIASSAQSAEHPSLNPLSKSETRQSVIRVFQGLCSVTTKRDN